MNLAMMWFDNSKIDLEKKINLAADYYRKKYGTPPNLCYVHPCMVKVNTIETEEAAPAAVEVRTTRSVLPNHFWIGINEATP